MTDFSDEDHIVEVQDDVVAITKQVNGNWYYLSVVLPSDPDPLRKVSITVYANEDGSEEPDAEESPSCADLELAKWKESQHNFLNSETPFRSYIAQTFSEAVSELEKHQADSEDTVAEIESALSGVKDTHESLLSEIDSS
jgi:hypothetical protein